MIYAVENLIVMLWEKIVVCFVLVVSLATCKYTGNKTPRNCKDCKDEDKIGDFCITQTFYLKEHETTDLECINDRDTLECDWNRMNCEAKHSVPGSTSTCNWSKSNWEHVQPLAESNPVENRCRIKQRVTDQQHSIYKCNSLPKDFTAPAICQAFLVVSTVAPEPPLINDGVDPIQLEDTSTSSALICKAEKGQPPVSFFQWFIGGKDFSDEAVLKGDGISEINVTKIEDLYKYNNGKVTCRIKHPGLAFSPDDNATLSVTYKPRLVDVKKEYEAREGSELTVPLVVAANPPLQSISVLFSSGRDKITFGLGDGHKESGITYRLVQLEKYPGERIDYNRYRLKISSVTEKVAGTVFSIVMNNRKDKKYEVTKSFKVVFTTSLSTLHISLIVLAAILILIAFIIIIVCYKKRRCHCGKRRGWSAWGRHDMLKDADALTYVEELKSFAHARGNTELSQLLCQVERIVRSEAHPRDDVKLLVRDSNRELQGNTNRTLEETRRGEHVSNGVTEHEDHVMLNSTSCQNGGFSRKNSRNLKKTKDNESSFCDAFLECCIG